MRILKISDVFFPRINGVSTSIKTFKNEFTSLGHEVTLIAPAYGDDDGDEQGLMRIPSRVIPFDPEDRLLKRKYIRALDEELLEKDFDIIHIETPFSAHFEGLRLAKRLNLPTVETYHTHFEEYFYHYLPFLPKAALKLFARKLNRWQCNSVDSIVVPSQAMLDILGEYGVNKPMQIIPTGIDKLYFKQGNGQAFRQKHDIPSDRPMLLHVGRVAHEKNIDFLFHMLDELRKTMCDVLLVVTGEGPALSHLKRLGEKLGLQKHLKFIGYLDRNTELLDCYASSDIFVFSSRTETQGLVLLEAMAQGVPVVSTAKLGTVDILKPEKGALIAEEEVKDFVAKVSSLLQDKSLYQQKQAEAKPYAELWSAAEMAKRMLAFYQQTIDDAKS